MQFDCGDCHKPHARSTAEEMVACSTCHTQMARAGLHALRAHASCRDCHAPHLWRTEQKGCLRCHATAREHARGRACAACHSFVGAGRPLPPRPL